MESMDNHHCLNEFSHHKSSSQCSSMNEPFSIAMFNDQRVYVPGILQLCRIGLFPGQVTASGAAVLRPANQPNINHDIPTGVAWRILLTILWDRD